MGRAKFDVSHSNLIKPSSNIPKAVKRVNDIYEKPTFMANILPGDIKQGSLGNCWFVASLTGLANVQDGIKRVCVEYDTSKLFFLGPSFSLCTNAFLEKKKKKRKKEKKENK